MLHAPPKNDEFQPEDDHNSSVLSVFLATKYGISPVLGSFQPHDPWFSAIYAVQIKKSLWCPRIPARNRTKNDQIFLEYPYFLYVCLI